MSRPPGDAHPSIPAPVRGDGGYALVVVMVFITLGLLVWAVSHRAAIQVLRTERVHRLRTDRDRGPAQAALDGLHRLQQEIPSSPSPYTYATVVAGEIRSYRVTLRLKEKKGKTRTWSVEVERLP